MGFKTNPTALSNCGDIWALPRFFLFAAALVGVGAPRPSSAQSSSLTLVQELSFAGEPKNVFILSYTPATGVHVLPATTLETNVKNQTLVIGRTLVPENPDGMVVMLGASASTGEVVSIAKKLQPASDDPITLLDTATLRSALEERRTELKTWQAQSAEQGASLERLQEDADVIANVGRIVDAEDELGAIRSDIERLSASLKLAQERIAALRQQEVPSNFQRREAELTSELNLLSTAVKNTEASALQKVSAASSELRQKMALIEATKNEHFDLLQRELQMLRNERSALERRVRVDPAR